MTRTQELLTEAFSSHVSGIRRECACGMVFFCNDPDERGGFEEGEFKELGKMALKHEAEPLLHLVHCAELQGKQYVIDCPCWEKKVKQLERFLEDHRRQIARYLNTERERRLKEVGEMEKVVE